MLAVTNYRSSVLSDEYAGAVRSYRSSVVSDDDAGAVRNYSSSVLSDGDAGKLDLMIPDTSSKSDVISDIIADDIKDDVADNVADEVEEDNAADDTLIDDPRSPADQQQSFKSMYRKVMSIDKIQLSDLLMANRGFNQSDVITSLQHSSSQSADNQLFNLDDKHNIASNPSRHYLPHSASQPNDDNKDNDDDIKDIANNNSYQFGDDESWDDSTLVGSKPNDQIKLAFTNSKGITKSSKTLNLLFYFSNCVCFCVCSCTRMRSCMCLCTYKYSSGPLV